MMNTQILGGILIPFIGTGPGAALVFFLKKQISLASRKASAFGLFGALEVAQRQYDLRCEVEAYLRDHPRAAVVNLGCGLDDTFRKCDNGLCHGCNVDLPDVIAVRNGAAARRGP